MKIIQYAVAKIFCCKIRRKKSTNKGATLLCILLLPFALVRRISSWLMYLLISRHEFLINVVIIFRRIQREISPGASFPFTLWCARVWRSKSHQVCGP
jgi:hypothetical protein